MSSKLITPSEFTICFMPGNPYGLRHLLYAGEPLWVAPLALCRETRPPQWLTVHRNGSLITCP
ncbi:hypothetical protein [Calothrix rhizosoleniae]|uniref:hypothetical protein n=1 Tax=Calothrix rhizosoleniae TaxID=888997 RepID=UPI001178A441|nr:hypothetical protein [Calothrix rhizosoleniae]